MRKAKTAAKTLCNFKFDPETIAALKSLVGKRGRDMTDVLRNLILTAGYCPNRCCWVLEAQKQSCNRDGLNFHVPDAVRLTEEEAGAVEAELRRLEADPTVSKRTLRLFMQSPMLCGHPVANLLTCPNPPFGCVACGPTLTIKYSENGVRDAESVPDRF